MGIYEASYQSPGFTQRYRILCIGNTRNIGNITVRGVYRGAGAYTGGTRRVYEDL